MSALIKGLILSSSVEPWADKICNGSFYSSTEPFLRIDRSLLSVCDFIFGIDNLLLKDPLLLLILKV
jgi:hypothetical protein